MLIVAAWSSNCLVHDLTVCDSHLCMAQIAKATMRILACHCRLCTSQKEASWHQSYALLHTSKQRSHMVHTSMLLKKWKVDDVTGIVTVFTDQGQYTARKLVLTAGSWMPDIMPELQVRI